MPVQMSASYPSTHVLTCLSGCVRRVMLITALETVITHI